MIVEDLPESGVQLTDPINFRSFKVVLKGAPTINSPDLRGITLLDQDKALVPIDLVPTLPGRPRTTNGGTRAARR